MKHLVCILGGYSPHFSPGGMIANNVLLELRDTYSITIIARKDKFGLIDEEKQNGMQIVRLNDFNHMFHSLFESKCKSSSRIQRLIFTFLLRCKQAINYCCRLCRRQDVSYAYIRRVERMLRKIHSKHKIDILIPVSEPHEAVFAAYHWEKKHQETIMIPYQLDFFAEGNSLYENKLIRKFRYPIQRKMEKKVIEASDALFALPPIYQYYRSNAYVADCLDKIKMTEHPLLKQHTAIPTREGNDKILITYAGSLDKNLRNPGHFLSVLSLFENKDRYTVNLFSFGNAQAVIDLFKEELDGMLVDHGRIPFDLLEIELSRTDILVTIGNNSEFEVPSKLFDLLSYGKPIVHFYYSDHDPYITYLDKYPFALCLKMDECYIPENAARFQAFCDENWGQTVDFDTVEKIYIDTTPKYVAKQFRKEIIAAWRKREK